MDYTRTEFNNDKVLYLLDGELNAYSSKKLEEDLRTDIENGKVKEFVFNFTDVDHIDSSGLRILVIAGKHNDNNGKKLTIIKAQDHVKRILELAELFFLEYSEKVL